MYQEDNGFSDVLKSVFLIILIPLNSGASTFLKGTAQGINDAESLGDSLQSALAPTAKKVVGIGKAVKRLVNQKGKSLHQRRLLKETKTRPRRRQYKQKRQW